MTPEAPRADSASAEPNEVVSAIQLEEPPRDKSRKETLEIPAALRAEAEERDHGTCRVCGEYLGDRRALHHIDFGGGFGVRRRHELGNVITIGWLPGNRDCHSNVHRHKQRFMQVLKELAAGQHGGATALQVLRWQAAARAREQGKAWTVDQVELRFRERCQRDGACLIYAGEPDVYGQLSSTLLNRLRGRPDHYPHLATHVAWFFATGKWPTQDLLHSCDRPGCVEISHLREGTHLENMQDRRERNPRYGGANPAARHAELVPVIRQRLAAGEKQWMVARSLGLSSSVISRIARGVNYPETT